jgi:hypothetical protein
MFAVGFGSERREKAIRRIAARDKTTAVILAAVHFEWMLKRTILALGSTPTKALRTKLEDVYRLDTKHGRPGFQDVWRAEVGRRYKNAALGTVLGKLTQIKKDALNVRGRLIHGNGTVKSADADKSIELFLGAGAKLRAFAAKQSVDIDAKLKMRPKAR